MVCVEIGEVGVPFCFPFHPKKVPSKSDSSGGHLISAPFPKLVAMRRTGLCVDVKGNWCLLQSLLKRIDGIPSPRHGSSQDPEMEDLVPFTEAFWELPAVSLRECSYLGL